MITLSATRPDAAVFFRVDASSQIGFGHLMRCRNLAEALQSRGVKTQFVRAGLSENRFDEVNTAWISLPGNSVGTVVDAEKTYEALLASQYRPVAVVVDHYAASAEWELFFRRRGLVVIVLDDLANRRHDCDILIDSNPLPANRYDGLVAEETRRLLGTDYVLLGLSKVGRLKLQPEVTKVVRRVFVCFGGGGDIEPLELVLFAARDPRLRDVSFDFVAGNDAVALKLRESMAKNSLGAVKHANNAQISGWVDDVGNRLRQADLAVGAGGSMTWERISLGVPSVVLAVSSNQEPTSAALSSKGLISYIGRLRDCTPRSVADEIVRLMHDQSFRQYVQSNGPTVIDGRGPDRCAEAIVTMSVKGVE